MLRLISKDNTTHSPHGLLGESDLMVSDSGCEMGAQEPSAPVIRPQAVVLIGWLTVLGCAFWFAWELTGLVASSSKWLAEADFKPLTGLITWSLAVAYFILRPALQFLALRPKGRREMIGITSVAAILAALAVLTIVVQMVVGLGHLVNGTVDPIFTIKGLLLWRHFAGSLMALCLIMKIYEVLKSEELTKAFDAAGAIWERQKLERARRKAWLD
jgi:hypothetical protein